MLRYRWVIQILIVFYVISVGALYAQSQVAFRNFNTNAGLPSNESYFLFQDREGYIWITTDHGVAKYNGYKFTQYTTKDGLTDNTVFSVKQDKAGRIWFLTYTGGVCYYDGKKFYPHPNNDTIISLFASMVPASWSVSDDKTLWFGFIRKGFYRIDTTSCRSYQITPGSYNLDSCYLYIINLPDSKFVFSMLASNEIKFDKLKDVTSIQCYPIHRTTVNNASLNFSMLRLPGPDNRIIIGLGNALVMLSDSGILYHRMLPKNMVVVQVKQTSDKKIWLVNVNSPAYLLRVDGNNISAIDSLSFTPTTSDILLDKSGNYWLSTLTKGIFMVPERDVKKYLTPAADHDVKVFSMVATKTNLYAGLPENTILKIDTLLNAVSLPTKRQPAGVSDITFTENGEPFSNLDVISWKKVNFFFSKIIKIGKDKYLAGGTGGFTMVENSKTIVNSTDIGFDKRITALGEISDNTYVIGTINGMYYFQTDGHYRLIKEPLLKDVRVTSCRVLNPNMYAVATRGDGVYLNIHGHKFMLDEARGLVSNLVEDVYFENDSVCWVGTYKGLSKVKFRLKGDSLYTKINCYSQEDGLCSDQINAIAGFKGYIWLGTNEGICYFKPENLRDDTLTVPFYFTDVSVNGLRHSFDSLNLTYDRNNLLIEYNALYYKAIAGVRYKFRLKGIDDWKYTDRNNIQYLGLPAGQYNFEIMAEDKYGRYKSAPNSLAFTITPRFTDTLFFKVMVTLVLFLISGIIVYLMFTYQRLKAQNVIKLLQAEFKALNYQINPHFIFNVLNSIQYYIIRKDTDKAVHFLNSFSVLIRRIVTNSRQQYTGVLEEVECLKEYLDLEKLRLDNKFDYEINIDSTIDIEEKIILPMILQPLVENSIWHGIVPANRLGMVKVDFKKEGDSLVCIVDDNGVGIKSKSAGHKKSTNNLSMAMSNVNERLKIISELNGSSWYIKIEDKSDKGYTDSGTVVTIMFPRQKK